MRRVAVGLLLLAALPLHAAPGDLDPQFGGGYIQRDIAGEEDDPFGMTALASGGTAIAGLHTLESGGLRRTLIDAVEAASERAAELGEQMAAKLAKR